MQVVVVGDLAWEGRYHLGDEAMSEVVRDQLRARGDTVTCIAGDPEITQRFYGVAAVPRLGFRGLSRTEQERLLDDLVSAAAGRAADPCGTRRTLDALRAADAVVIAGGGNLNSIGIHHVFERVAVKRIAEQLGVPLYVTSQTVGPHLRDAERALVAEIARYARVFGVRERSSAALMRGLCGTDARIIQTLDDALLLEPGPVSVDLPTAGRYAVASFTFHAKTTALHADDYYRELAAILDQLSAQLDVDVLLLPHMSTFEVPNALGVEDDVYGHTRIVDFSRSGRLRAVPLLPARALLSVTANAEFSVSTRYHPLIFGAALGVPALGIVTSYYSAIRMRGALANVGMEDFAIPFEHWRSSFAPDLIEALRTRLPEFREHLRAAGTAGREHQQRWWDELSASMHEGRSVAYADVAAPTPVHWGDSRMQESLALARGAQELTHLDRLNALMDDEQQRQHNCDTDFRLERLEEELAHLRRTVAEVRHRQRPPGAGLRDAVRRKIASGRT